MTGSTSSGDTGPLPVLVVLFGGRSVEHAISCVSAASILAAVDRSRYAVVPVGIRRDGRWVLAPDDPEAMTMHGRELPEVRDGPGVVLSSDPARHGLLVVDGDEAGRFVPVDVVFPVLHGTFGEDGTVQGLLETADLPYVGSGVLAGAAGMDKQFTKIVLEAAGLEVAPGVVVTAGSTVQAADRDRLGLPVFVKPARAGSSVGISRVDDWADLDAALETAFAVDRKVVVEARVVGREVECAVLESDPPGRGGEASMPAEIRLVGGREWYDFEAKYLDDVSEFDVPARLPAEVTERLREAALRAFDALGCEGLARVDFFVRADGGLVVNEVNTMPGFTPISMFPRMWAHAGLSYEALVDRLIANALDRASMRIPTT